MPSADDRVLFEYFLISFFMLIVFFLYFLCHFLLPLSLVPLQLGCCLSLSSHLFLFLILHRIVPLETTLYYTVLHYTTLHYTTLHYTSSHYTTQHHTTSHYTILHYTTLHYTTPHLTIPYRTVQPVLPTGCIYLKKVLSPLFSVSFRVSPTDHVLNKCEVDERMAEILLWHKVRWREILVCL